VPLVIQVGKWRREITLPEVKPCTDNRVDDPQLLRLPRKRSEGNIPRMALATGGYDRIECMLRKIGIDDSEFTPESGPGRVNLYAGKGDPVRPGGLVVTRPQLPTTAYAASLNGGATFTPATSLWADAKSLSRYDMVVLGCEGNWFLGDKTDAIKQGLVDYTNRGGRVYASHWHGAWIQFGPPPWDTVASFVPPNTLNGLMHQLPDLGPSPDQSFDVDIDTSFPKGEAMADWLVNVKASDTKGKLPLWQGKHSVFSVNPTVAQRWIYSDAIPTDSFNQNPKGVQYMTFNTPVGAAEGKECGRTCFTDIHVSGGALGTGDEAGPMFPFPNGCVTKELSPQEKALEFMIFELSSCVQPEKEEPVPPRIVE
jgi:hypothetical protein